MGKPKDDTDSYNMTVVDGINVYVHADVTPGPTGIQIKHSKFLFKDSIIVDGIIY